MRPPRPSRSLIAVSAAAVFGLLWLGLGDARSAPPQEAALTPPSYDDAFRAHWYDGFAELAGYDLNFRRYGVDRSGVAVTIFVTETFSNAARVKADPGRHPESDELPVMKLNLIQDFPTGVYDYNLMSSSFVALEGINKRPAGSATKISFSSQEWCGHAYAQLLFDAETIRFESHSYFDGEGDQSETLKNPARGISEDALFHWARGFAAPAVAPGASAEVQILRSLEEARLEHVPMKWSKAKLSRAAKSQTLKAPAGSIEVTVASAAIEAGRSWTFYIEKAFPHRLIGWDRSDGVTARLLKSERLKYWQLNGPGGEAALKRIGLEPRARRRP